MDTILFTEYFQEKRHGPWSETISNEVGGVWHCGEVMVLPEPVWEVAGPRFCAGVSHCGNLIGRGALETCLKVGSTFYT